jgi:hypothetical protein
MLGTPDREVRASFSSCNRAELKHLPGERQRNTVCIQVCACVSMSVCMCMWFCMCVGEYTQGGFLSNTTGRRISLLGFKIFENRGTPDSPGVDGGFVQNEPSLQQAVSSGRGHTYFAYKPYHQSPGSGLYVMQDPLEHPVCRSGQNIHAIYIKRLVASRLQPEDKPTG